MKNWFLRALSHLYEYLRVSYRLKLPLWVFLAVLAAVFIAGYLTGRP